MFAITTISYLNIVCVMVASEHNVRWFILDIITIPSNSTFIIFKELISTCFVTIIHDHRFFFIIGYIKAHPFAVSEVSNLKYNFSDIEFKKLLNLLHQMLSNFRAL